MTRKWGFTQNRRAVFNMKRRTPELRIWQIFLVAAILFISCPVSDAQTPSTGALVGRITDPSGAVVPDVTVTVTSAATGTTRSTKSGSTGVYNIPLLAPGAYSVEATATNFQTYKAQSVMINVTESEELDITLTVGSTSM
jgi:hypothetical protein